MKRIGRWLALGGVLAASALGVSGCLVATTTEFGDPPPTRPFLNSGSSQPPLHRVLVIKGTSPQPVTFSVQVQSEDAGSPLQAYLVANYPSQTIVGQATLAPGTFSQSRLLTIEWTNPPATQRGSLSPGCYPLTLVVSHAFRDFDVVPAVADDADTVVWWVLIDDPANPNFLSSATIAGQCALSESQLSSGGAGSQ